MIGKLKTKTINSDRMCYNGLKIISQYNIIGQSVGNLNIALLFPLVGTPLF